MSFWDKFKDIYVGVRIEFGGRKKPEFKIWAKKVEAEEDETQKDASK